MRCAWSASWARSSGPRGLMPNPKVGTVTPDVATAVKNAKSGQVRYRVDKAGIVHCTIGKAGFEPLALRENLQALMADLQRAKPASSKGIYLQARHAVLDHGAGRDRRSVDFGLESLMWVGRCSNASVGHRRRPQADESGNGCESLMKAMPAQMVCAHRESMLVTVVW